jgi:hypothetical protein
MAETRIVQAVCVMFDFHQTRMGQTFFESTMPRIAKALERIATKLEAKEPIRCNCKGCICGVHYVNQIDADDVTKAMRESEKP